MEETAGLQKLMEEHGEAKMSWVKLKKKPGDKSHRILANRKNRDLQVKARGMKFGFLKEAP